MTEDQQHRGDLIAGLLVALLIILFLASSMSHQGANQPTQAQQEQPSQQHKVCQKQPTQQVCQKQPRHQHNQENPTEPPNYITFIMWFAGATVAIFTALVAAFGIFTAVFTLRHKKEADDMLVKIKEHERKARKITKRMEANAEDADKDPDRINQVIRESKQQQLSDIDKARIDALELQKDKKFEEALAKWLAIAEFTNDREAASEAYFSAAYLIQEYDDKYKEKDEATVNRAIDLYSKSIGLHQNPDAYNNRGNAKGKKGGHEEAIADFNEAIKLKPDYPEAYNNRGAAKNDLGRHDEAISDYNEAIRIKPDYPEAYYNRGIAKKDLGRHDEAIEDYTKAIRLKPNLAEAYNSRGAAKSQMGKHEDAISDYNEAIRIKPDYPEAYNNRGNTKSGMNKHEEAIEDYTKAIKLDPDLVSAYIGQGVANASLGKYDEALADLRKVLELEPENELAKQAIVEIEARGKNE